MGAKGRPYVRYEPGQKARLGNRRARIERTTRWESGVKRLRNPRSGGGNKFQIFKNQQRVTMSDAERYYNQFHEIPVELVEAYREVLQPGLMFALRMDAKLSSASLQCPKGEIQTIEPDDYGLGNFAKKGAILVYVGIREATRKGKDSNRVEQLIKSDVHAFLLNGRLVVPRTISMVIPTTGDD